MSVLPLKPNRYRSVSKPSVSGASEPLSSMSNTANRGTIRSPIAAGVHQAQPPPTAPVVRLAPVNPKRARSARRPSVRGPFVPSPSMSSDPASTGPIGPVRRDAKSSSRNVPL